VFVVSSLSTLPDWISRLQNLEESVDFPCFSSFGKTLLRLYCYGRNLQVLPEAIGALPKLRE
jgi:hypothetical protein